MLSRMCSCGRGEAEDREELSQVTCKVVVVGDGAVGKTSLLTRYVTDHFDEKYQPTIFENQATPVVVNKKKVLLNLFDTAGQEAYEHLRPVMYPHSDVIMICFAVNSPPSLINVMEKWQPEVRSYLPKVPILLLGLKTDLRNETTNRPSVSLNALPGPSAVDYVNGNIYNHDLWALQTVSYSAAQKVATLIGAKAYFECSSKLNEGLIPIFQEAARLGLQYQRRSSFRNLLPFNLK